MQFLPTYVTAIITIGNKAVLSSNEKYYYLPGLLLDVEKHKFPKDSLCTHLLDSTGVLFDSNWMRFIGASHHIDSSSPDNSNSLKDSFIVIHYWIDASLLEQSQFFANYELHDLNDIAKNISGKVLPTDSLAAQHVLEMKSNNLSVFQNNNFII